MSEEAAEPGSRLWTYRRRFTIDGLDFEVATCSRSRGLISELKMLGVPVSRDRTPLVGEAAVRNHRLETRLPDGRLLEVEAGWISPWSIGIAARLDGAPVHESHPGRVIAYPERYRQRIIDAEKEWKDSKLQGQDFGVWKRNRVPIAVDILLGLLFFAVAKLSDLSTAALVGAGVGLALVVAQRFVKADLLGGLAMFGIVMLLLSAALAIAFQDDMAVKQRGTILGLISATLFLGDGLFGGNRLGRGLSRYLPYKDLDPARLALGMGLLGLVMAMLNLVVATYTSTDFWLFYTTFVDFCLVMLLILLVFRYARGRMLPRGYRAPEEGQPS